MLRPVYQVLCVSLAALALIHPAEAKKPAKNHAPAKAAPKRNTAVQSAFLFAEKGNWDEAKLHAHKSGNSALKKLILWLSLQDQQSGASFGEITRFMEENPDWPKMERLALRAEQAIHSSAVTDAQLTRWFDAHPPVSGAGKVALAELAARKNAPPGYVAQLLRSAWETGDFDENEEARILEEHGSALAPQDHAARASRLIWEGKFASAERMLPLLAADLRTLMRARIALMSDDKDGAYLALQMEKERLNDPGLIYARMLWRDRRDDDAGVREMLLMAPPDPPFADKWWRLRERQVREAIDARNIDLAARLLAGRGNLDGAAYADALWLEGWLMLEFQHRPQEAYTRFYAMFDSVKYPVSKARAAYWAARAAEGSGDMAAAGHWYNTASAYPSTFYGQLASAAATGSAPLKIPADPIVSQEAKQRFRGRELVRAITLSLENGQEELANTLANHLIDEAAEPRQAALTATLMRELHSTHMGVRAAKRALQSGVLLLEAGYPRIGLGSDAPIEPALAMAIARQESEFDARAKSRAGALGLMQLLPGTAKETARKHDIPYAELSLTQPSYNVRLGSLYLARQIQNFNGSYVQAIAAYNAGPRRVREWVGDFGLPGNTPEEAVNWIEKIPYSETRNYVQRVLENLQVYRHLTAGSRTPNLRIWEDLVR